MKSAEISWTPWNLRWAYVTNIKSSNSRGTIIFIQPVHIVTKLAKWTSMKIYRTRGQRVKARAYYFNSVFKGKQGAHWGSSGYTISWNVALGTKLIFFTLFFWLLEPFLTPHHISSSYLTPYLSEYNLNFITSQQQGPSGKEWTLQIDVWIFLNNVCRLFHIVFDCKSREIMCLIVSVHLSINHAICGLWQLCVLKM